MVTGDIEESASTPRGRLDAFYARGERAWQEYLRTGVSSPADEVFARLQARIDQRRKELFPDPIGSDE